MDIKADMRLDGLNADAIFLKRDAYRRRQIISHTEQKQEGQYSLSVSSDGPEILQYFQGSPKNQCRRRCR